MVLVSSYDEEGNLHDSQQIPATKADVLDALSQIDNPSGSGLAHFQVGKGEPISIQFDPEEVEEATDLHTQRGGFLGPLLSMIPIVGPLLSGVLGGNGFDDS